MGETARRRNASLARAPHRGFTSLELRALPSYARRMYNLPTSSETPGNILVSLTRAAAGERRAARLLSTQRCDRDLWCIFRISHLTRVVFLPAMIVRHNRNHRGENTSRATWSQFFFYYHSVAFRFRTLALIGAPRDRKGAPLFLSPFHLSAFRTRNRYIHLFLYTSPSRSHLSLEQRLFPFISLREKPHPSDK